MIDPIANKNNLHCDDCLYCQPYCNGKGERIYALCLRFPPNSTGGFSKTNGQICGVFEHLYDALTKADELLKEVLGE